MLPKQLLKDYLSFTRKDRIFTTIIVLVVGGSLFLPRLLAPSHPPLSLHRDTALLQAMGKLDEQERDRPGFPTERRRASDRYERSATKGFTEGELFRFDPNTIGLEEWRRLGLNERTSKTILNYVGKGGKFYKPEDLQKIWGLPEGFYQRVKPFVAIAAVAGRSFPPSQNVRPEFPRNDRKPTLLNINEADTAALIDLPGIGSRLSARIVAFREKLGGFYSIEQVGETYGLPDSTFQRIKSRLQTDEADIRKIDLNAAGKDELKTHPYIRWNLANAIVEYRNQHGPFKTLDELRNIALVDETTFTRIAPYLKL